MPSARQFFAASPPCARRRVLAQLQRRRFMFLSVRDALRAAPRSRAGLRSPRVGRRRRRRTLLCHLLFSVHAVAGMHAKMGTLLHAALPSQHKQLAIVLRTLVPCERPYILAEGRRRDGRCHVRPRSAAEGRRREYFRPIQDQLCLCLHFPRSIRRSIERKWRPLADTSLVEGFMRA